LLPSKLQRAVFVEVMSTREAWPRARSLFGAPPYAFLLPQDAGMLSAAGISFGRKNMTYNEFQLPNYSQFGSAHMVDEYEREYRVSQENDDLSAPVAVLSLGNFHLGARGVLLLVRLKKRTTRVRVEINKSEDERRTLLFPRVNEKLRLTPTAWLIRVLGLVEMGEAGPVELTVTAIRRATTGASSTAILRAEI
jgi:hypothetical protein